MLIEFKKILIEGDHLTIYFKDGSVSTLNISTYKSKNKLIEKLLLPYEGKATFKSLAIKDETITAFLYSNKEAIIKHIEFGEYKTELNTIIKAVFKKIDEQNDTK